jgi:3-oxoacyl-[acyl-carrier protein] reductase
LQGRSALVTGAASGIGFACAEALAAEGATVVGIDLNAARDASFEIVRADLSDEADVKQAVSAITGRLAKIDILVNSAGIEIDAPLATFDLADFDRMYAVNVRGTMLIGREVLPFMPDGARIINMASELAFLGRAGSSAYCATKGAILSITRSWARELAPRIHVNAVAPGPIDTPLLHFDSLPPDIRALEIGNPLGRIGWPREVAAAVVFLAGPGASFITGQCLGVDGGAAMR